MSGGRLCPFTTGEQTVARLRNVSKVYTVGQQRVEALRGISLTVQRGHFIAITGASGSGKSTCMNILGCLDVATGGDYELEGNCVGSLSQDALAAVRNTTLGYVFQGFNLLAHATARENVELPLIYAGIPANARRARAMTALAQVGLEDRAYHRPMQLSGGQQQRVAIARALVNGPSVILADEPTGNLDSTTSREIMDHLLALNRQGITIIMITHEPEVAAYARRQVVFRDGRIIDDRSSVN